MIVGLPRSRTAWWSVVTTTPVSVCVHEPLQQTSSFADLAAYWDKPQRFAGVSESGIAPQLGRILAEIGPRTLMVIRDRKDVEQSLEHYFAGVDFDRGASSKYLDDIGRELFKWSRHKLVKCVGFDALNDYATVCDCFDWLMPGNPFAVSADLMHMNVQVSREYALTQARKGHNGWYRP